jgi:hypothetical protein
MYKIIRVMHKMQHSKPSSFIKYLQNIFFAEIFHNHMYTKEEKKELVKHF